MVCDRWLSLAEYGEAGNKTTMKNSSHLYKKLSILQAAISWLSKNIRVRHDIKRGTCKLENAIDWSPLP
jgi:hypothetical protein